MKLHPYKLAGANIPKALLGLVLNVKVAESAEDAKALCKDGNEGRIIDLFNQQHILNQERVGKAIAEGDAVKKALADETVTDEAQRVANAMKIVQDATDEYLSGAKAAGVPSEAKAALAEKKGAVAKLATMSDKDRDKAKALLASLGITV